MPARQREVDERVRTLTQPPVPLRAVGQHPISIGGRGLRDEDNQETSEDKYVERDETCGPEQTLHEGSPSRLCLTRPQERDATATPPQLQDVHFGHVQNGQAAP